MNMREKLGVAEQGQAAEDPKLLIEYINLKLEALGLPIYGEEGDFRFISLTKSLISSYQEQSRLLSYYLCPADQRIQNPFCTPTWRAWRPRSRCACPVAPSYWTGTAWPAPSPCPRTSRTMPRTSSAPTAASMACCTIR
jgi:hypothetical protein